MSGYQRHPSRSNTMAFGILRSSIAFLLKEDACDIRERVVTDFERLIHAMTGESAKLLTKRIVKKLNLIAMNAKEACAALLTL
mmetsp:Transcript_4008/g.4361  ORF Transcript_4008/g.4361 Transcript_4008/m.4361 type:complete len:83 (+) Transcript_4008:652-900(+)